MEKLFKQDKRVFLLLAGLVSISFLIAIFGESIAQWWRLAIYTHPSQAEGFKIGDTKSDIIFFGNGIALDDGDSAYIGNSAFIFNDSGFVESVVIVSINKQGKELPLEGLPIKTVRDLIKKFGQPNILMETQDSKTRRYTYSNDGLNTGTSYEFQGNRLYSVMFGEIEWRRNWRSNLATYVVDGVRYCPGDRCPFDGEGLKPGWKNKTVRDLVELYQ